MDKAVAEEFANRLGIGFIETSAKLSENVEAAFVAMAREIKKQYGEFSETVKDHDGSIVIHGTPVTNDTQTRTHTGCCGGS